MRLAVISDIHVLGESEKEMSTASVSAIGEGLSRPRRMVRRGLHRARDRFWNWHPDSRRDCFLRALDDMEHYDPDLLIANGDYGGDTHGVGLSDESTFESASAVIDMIRDVFGDKCRLSFGDHDIGKYSTHLRQGGIRLASIEQGEEVLGIQSFWEEAVGDYHLIGVNSSLLGLHMFLPEAIEAEIPEWTRRRDEHIQQVCAAFDQLPDTARIVLFCHDPSALGVLSELPAIRRRQPQIVRTILGHLHSPGLLRLARMLPPLPRFNPKYPIARILAHSLSEKGAWRRFKPVLCPSTFGTGRHVSGGALFVEGHDDGQLVIRRHRIKF